MKRVNIVASLNAFGLNRDVELMFDVLARAGFRVTVNKQPFPPRAGWRHIHRGLAFGRKVLRNKLLRRPLFDVNILLETVHPAWLPLARVNCLFPNQEWFHREHVAHLRHIDLVLCKTRHAQQIFTGLGGRTEFVSFTSVDRRAAGDGGAHDGLFHLAGRSHMKGTDTLLDVWLRHPEWPRLTVVQNRSAPRHVEAPNVAHLRDYLDDETLRCHQNAHRVHLCPSEAEGFGHYIVEAMSCGAVVVTTDAPPMNELVAPDRGVVVPYATERTHHVGSSFQVDPGALEAAIERVLALGTEERLRLGARARGWYEENDRLFRRRLVEVVSAL